MFKIFNIDLIISPKLEYSFFIKVIHLIVKIKLDTEVYEEENPLPHCRNYQFGVVVPVNMINTDTRMRTRAHTHTHTHTPRRRSPMATPARAVCPAAATSGTGKTRPRELSECHKLSAWDRNRMGCRPLPSLALSPVQLGLPFLTASLPS